MPLGKLIFRASELGHVGQVVEAGLVDFQAFFTQIKTRKERSVHVRLCLETADYFEENRTWRVEFLCFYCCQALNLRLVHFSF